MVWAFRKNLISWRHVQEYSLQRLSDSELFFEVFELSKLNNDNLWKRDDILEKLKNSETSDLENTKIKWLIVLLSSLVNQQNSIIDPTLEIEDIAYKFNFPIVLDELIRWKPALDNVGSPETFSRNNNYKNYYDCILEKIKFYFLQLKI